MIPAIMAKIAACGDPYLYAVTHPRFRAEIDKMFCASRADAASSNSRRQEMQSECETVQMDDNDRRKKPIMRNDSSVCDESTID